MFGDAKARAPVPGDRGAARQNDDTATFERSSRWYGIEVLRRIDARGDTISAAFTETCCKMPE